MGHDTLQKLKSYNLFIMKYQISGRGSFTFVRLEYNILGTR